MILLSLNVRGVGGPLKSASLKRLLEKTQPSVIFFQETLVEAEKARNFMFTLRPDWMMCAVSSVGNSGGLLASWDPTCFEFAPVLSVGGILLSGSCLTTKRKLTLLNVYAPCKDRKLFWEKVDRAGLLALDNLILAGDLNLSTSPEESWGDFALTDSLAGFFKGLFTKYNLVDAAPVEAVSTWRNGRVGTESISKRLDRFLVAGETSSVLRPFPCMGRVPFHFDHAPIFLQLEDDRLKATFPFKFNSAWIQDESFIALVREVWSDASLSHQEGAQNIIVLKLSSLKEKTKSWSKVKKFKERLDLEKIEAGIADILYQKARGSQPLDYEEILCKSGE
jgi:hypothetical protein